jgi:hypothetical protein
VRHAREPQGRGFTSAWSFDDLAVHRRDVFWMDPKTVQK